MKEIWKYIYIYVTFSSLEIWVSVPFKSNNKISAMQYIYIYIYIYACLCVCVCVCVCIQILNKVILNLLYSGNQTTSSTEKASGHNFIWCKPWRWRWRDRWRRRSIRKRRWRRRGSKWRKRNRKFWSYRCYKSTAPTGNRCWNTNRN